MGVKKIPIGKLIDPLTIYPVGSLYLSMNSVNPAELFGGKWEQITGYFLRAANDTGTGGEDTVTLSVNQIPSHNHGYTTKYGKSASGGDNYSVASNTAVTGSYDTGYTGGGQPHNNMPKYQNVYAWYRTA